MYLASSSSKIFEELVLGTRQALTDQGCADDTFDASMLHGDPRCSPLQAKLIKVALGFCCGNIEY
jgi:hypothetical protein